MGRIRESLLQRRELAAYAAAGLFTTAVNYVVYSVLTVVCGLGINFSNVIAWAAAVFVAFITNKSFVFQQTDWSFKIVFREGALFLGSRLLSGAVSIGLVPVLMWAGITRSILGIPGFLAKFLAECVAMVLSFLLSKYAIFKK